MKPILLLLLWLACLPVLALLAPLPIPYYQDFSVSYFSNRALLHGIPLYDYPAQLEWVRAQTGPAFEFHPYPYPPWYALLTLPVALLPIEAAARWWFLLNLTMIAAAVWLLTPRWSVLARWLGILAAVLFIPAFGLLIVGQYSAPVLLGMALFIWAARRQSPSGVAAALGLMTFKPHIGLFAALAAFAWLLFHPSATFARRAIVITALLAMGLALSGLLADSHWPQTYLTSLMRYREIPGVQTCGLCASLSIALLRLLTGQASTGQAALLSLALGMGLFALLFWRFRTQGRNPDVLMSLAIVFTLLIDPYLLNYDYLLLLLPLTILTESVHALPGRAILLTAYLLPWLALALGRQGNPLLAASALLTLGLWWNTVKRADARVRGAP